MSWDGIRRRASDSGVEAPEVTLGRIDENIKFLKTGAEVVRVQLANHEKEDVVKFDQINKTIWRASGIACGASAVFLFIINTLSKH